MKKDPGQLLEFETISCPLCGSVEEILLLKGRDNLYRLPGEFQVVCCRKCRHVFMNPRPTLDTIGLCYPASYGPHQSEKRTNLETGSAMKSKRNPWYLSRLARRIPGLRRLYYWLADSKSQIIPAIEPEPKRVLEIGCATGNFLDRLRKNGWEATGVEPAERPAGKAREMRFDVHVGTLESAAFAEGSFDAVFAWMVIEHLHDPKQTLQEMHRILKPRGWILFSVPNFACWERWFFGRCWHALELPRHLHQFTPRTLRTMLTETGFEAVTILHQRNILNIVGSSGIVLKRRFPHGTLGQRLIDWTDQPTLWWQLALAPLAKFLAFIHQGGRLTVIARRSEAQLPAAKLSP
jgi:SAM-dependent methyltransferase